MKSFTIGDLIQQAIAKLGEATRTLSDSIKDMHLIDAYLTGSNAGYKNQFYVVQDLPQNTWKAAQIDKEQKDMPPKYADGSFRQKGNSLEYRFMLNGAQRYVYAPTRQECWNKRTELIKKNKKKPETKAKAQLFNDWLSEWFELYKVNKLKPDTLTPMRTYIQNDIRPAFHDIALKNVTTLQIQKFLSSFNETPNKRYKIALILGECIRQAFIVGLIKANPFLGVESKRPESESFKAFSFDQQEQILASIDNEIIKDAYIILCCTGMRIGEFLALDLREDIDYTSKLIHVHASRSGRSNQIGKTKTKSSKRYIPFTDTLAETIRHYEQITTGQLITYQQVYKYLRHVLDALELKDGYTPHSCRHTFGSVAYHIGIQPKQIQSWMGHATLDMTLNIYTELLKYGNSFVKSYLIDLAHELKLIP